MTLYSTRTLSPSERFDDRALQERPSHKRYGTANPRAFQFALSMQMLAGLLLCACKSAEEVNLEQALVREKAALRAALPFPILPDMMRPGDTRAKTGGFIIHPNTEFCSVEFVDRAIATTIAPDSPDKVKIGSFASPDPDQLKKHNIPYSTLNGGGVSRTLGVYASDLEGVKSFNKYCPDNNINILITQRVGLNEAGEPYRVTLTARQGNRFWSDSIERKRGDSEPEVYSLRDQRPLHLLKLKISSDAGVLANRFNYSLFGEKQ
jgi:hypothetical protein